MSGHSKWSKVKHQKEAVDAVKGKLFTKTANAIIIAVKEGGGITDPESNFKLRLAVERAKSINMPKENIQRAIERAGKADSVSNLTEAIYEAFGPRGIGILIKVTTDNRMRTVAELKNILERSGGVLASSGAVSHLFQQVGLIEIAKDGKKYDEILEDALEGGAIDIEESPDNILIYTNPNDLHRVREYLVSKGGGVNSFELYFRPITKIPVSQKEDIEKIEKLLEALEEREDVQRVFSNYQINV
ncbi:hypothetical protein A3D78_04820 [Candidatus Gottesmanbacteria bacterium RIFCSPHIGHO2_02_FULL_39_14]|uniref:Probable transcriptional regulatory protein A3D78_04820 n=2 Tax=Candidatus Gottesmaniibacteriota TaxID=1752720 RepID=A0A1F5ZTY7_9BACT|nr:MAG: hypothetical protein A3D78_04820 [Candidatus Gottesmanbacteria bacterium RIFCSPHIGHO2_02_FULL_39_14]OGG32463.1 MAG: hypothetical protein A3I51_05540 [Candidatus Gottesmanbacteria bacterium RIFCSPLOWO2_02_FULL_38_8]